MLSRITVFAMLVSFVGLVLMQSPASAGHGDISLPITTFIQADEGEVVQLGLEQVDPELVGANCAWEFHANNQESVHPGNDLILSTGGVDTVVPGVEDVPNQVLDVTGSFRLGETVMVSLRMGPDEVFSAGLSVEVVCEEDVASSTATTTPASAATPTTIAAVASTTTNAPVATTTPDVETEVAGQVETAAPVTSSTAASALAVTGPSSFTGLLVGLGVLLLLVGARLVQLGSRVWH